MAAASVRRGNSVDVKLGGGGGGYDPGQMMGVLLGLAAVY